MNLTGHGSKPHTLGSNCSQETVRPEVQPGSSARLLALTVRTARVAAHRFGSANKPAAIPGGRQVSVVRGGPSGRGLAGPLARSGQAGTNVTLQNGSMEHPEAARNNTTASDILNEVTGPSLQLLVPARASIRASPRGAKPALSLAPDPVRRSTLLPLVTRWRTRLWPEAERETLSTIRQDYG